MKYLSLILVSFVIITGLNIPLATSKVNNDLLLTGKEFSKLSHQNQVYYIRELQRTVMGFELKQKYNQAQIPKSHLKNYAWIDALISKAYAFNQNNFCIIGGVERKRRLQKSGPLKGQLACSVNYRSCSPPKGARFKKSNSFRCGFIFGSVCVEKGNSPYEISQRCFENSNNKVNPKNYSSYEYKSGKKLRPLIEKLFNRNCKDGDQLKPNTTNPDGCEFLSKRLSYLKAQIQSNPSQAPQPPPSSKPTPRTNDGSSCSSPVNGKCAPGCQLKDKICVPCPSGKCKTTTTQWDDLKKHFSKNCNLKGQNRGLDQSISHLKTCSKYNKGTTGITKSILSFNSQKLLGKDQASRRKQFFDTFGLHYQDALYLFCESNPPLGKRVQNIRKAHSATIRELSDFTNVENDIMEFRSSFLKGSNDELTTLYSSRKRSPSDFPDNSHIRLKTNEPQFFKRIDPSDISKKAQEKRLKAQRHLLNGYNKFYNCMMESFVKNANPNKSDSNIYPKCRVKTTTPKEKNQTIAYYSLANDLKQNSNFSINFPLDVKKIKLGSKADRPTNHIPLMFSETNYSTTEYKPTYWDGKSVTAFNHNEVVAYKSLECEYKKPPIEVKEQSKNVGDN